MTLWLHCNCSLQITYRTECLFQRTVLWSSLGHVRWGQAQLQWDCGESLGLQFLHCVQLHECTPRRRCTATVGSQIAPQCFTLTKDFLHFPQRKDGNMPSLRGNPQKCSYSFCISLREAKIKLRFSSILRGNEIPRGREE